MATVDLKGKRGDSLPFRFTFKDGNGDPIPLTGAIIFFTIKESIDDADADAVYKKDISSHEDAANGISSFKMTGEDCADLDHEYVFDIQVVFADGTILTYLDGHIDFSKDSTRRTS